MNATASYDNDLQMFTEKPHAVDRKHVEFQRWLAEHWRYEHEVSGPSSGELTEKVEDT